jgi:hypothetical protein
VSESVSTQNSAFELAKSLLVIPVTVAVVMGIGFGLSRVAERKQAQTGQPDVRPTDVAADGTITLPMQFALVGGQVVYHHPTLTNWQHADDFALWHIPLEAGRYAVELNYACDMANAGSTVKIEVGDSPLFLKIADTGGTAMSKNVRAGEVNLTDSHWYNLKISATEIARKTVMNLRGVKLIPIKQ